MTYDVIPKVYEVDYSFIVKNYLNEELWDKEWNIYSYKDVLITLSLCRIDVYDRSIEFVLKLKDNKGYDTSTYFYYYTRQGNMTILKKQINGGIFSLLEYYEKNTIKNSSEYDILRSKFVDEDDNLKSIAEAFLYEHGVNNTEICDAYIDNYVSNNRKRYTVLDNYVEANKYVTLPEYFLVFTKSVGDDIRYDKVAKKLYNKFDINYINNLFAEAEEVCEFNEEYKESMMNELEAI